MPSLTLRLTDEEHAALARWAFESKRSMQGEIIWRLFLADLRTLNRSPGLSEREPAAAGMTTTQPEEVGRISRDAEGPKAQPSPPRSESSDEVQPDWRPTKRKK